MQPAEAAQPVRPGRAGQSCSSCSLAFAVFAYVFDQLTKLWVTSTMTEGERIPVLPPLLHWFYIRNSGAAFLHRRERHLGVHDHHGGRLRRDPAAAAQARLAVVGAGARAAARRRAGQPDGPAVPRAVLRAWAMWWTSSSCPNFAIFNIADSAVVSAVVIICLLTLRGISLDGSRHTKDTVAKRCLNGAGNALTGDDRPAKLALSRQAPPSCDGGRRRPRGRRPAPA